MVLIPGMLNTAAVWDGVRACLGDGADVCIPDVAGSPSVSDMAQSAWAAIGEQGADRPLLLCGFSMGGYVALELLRRFDPEPAGLVLLATSARGETEEGAAARLKAIAAMEKDYGRFVGNVADFSTSPAHPRREQVKSRLADMAQELGIQAAIQQTRAVRERRDARDLLPQVRCPALVACGRDDRVTPMPLSEEMAGLLPRARLRGIETAGHLVPLEQPAAVAGLLTEALQGW
jgi:pimeloyl-ACP methyl ester carboxylesterase